ncbi:MAG: glycosyltransferase [Bacillota bacterium]|nr:glycosyltransferase [Bacillota bacterium]
MNEQEGRNGAKEQGPVRQILCVSTASYLPFPSRKQNVMERLSDAEILYIDPPVTFLAPLKDPEAKERLGAYKKPGTKVRENITVFAAPPVWPFFNKYRFINRRNQKRLARYLKKLMKAHGFQRPLLWCYSPTSCDLAPLLPHSALVYDCVDRHSAYPGMIDPEVVDKMEEDLARQADMIFSTAAGLYDTLIKYNENTALLPNGVNYRLFSQAAEAKGEPSSSGPVFGFVGMLQSCIDYSCLEAVARAWPEGELRLIGRPLPGVDYRELKVLPNVKFLGLLPQEELPEQIRQFDVCLNPFRGGELSRDVSPLKFYEYLATGKPVVSTPEPGQVQDYRDVVFIGATPEEFVDRCREALAEAGTAEGAEKARRRMEYGQACSWESRVAEMEALLRQRGIY